jgi:hypothetical protein
MIVFHYWSIRNSKLLKAIKLKQVKIFSSDKEYLVSVLKRLETTKLNLFLDRAEHILKARGRPKGTLTQACFP